MGRWTNNHNDQVFAAKIENIVNNILKKNKEESDEKKRVHFSIQSFLENLDEQDLFTCELIEILIKELADRKQCNGPSDKLQISTRTLESLRALTRQSNVYQVPGSSSNVPLLPRHRLRRRRGEQPGLAYPYELMESQSEEDLDELGAAEGARLDSSLHDAYSSNMTGWSRYARVYPYHIANFPHIYEAHRPRVTDVGPRGLSRIPSASTRFRGIIPRQGSTRNTVEDGTSNPEFTDFTLRRRNSSRQLQANRDVTIGDEEVGDPRELTPRPSSAQPVLPPVRQTSSPFDLVTLLTPRSPTSLQNDQSTENQAHVVQEVRPFPQVIDTNAQSHRPPLYRVLPHPQISTRAGGSHLDNGWQTYDTGRRLPNPSLTTSESISTEEPVVGVSPPSLNRPSLLHLESWENNNESVRYLRESEFEREFSTWFAPDMMLDQQRNHQQAPQTRIQGQEALASLPTPRSVSPNTGSETPEDVVSNANATVASTTTESTSSSAST